MPSSSQNTTSSTLIAFATQGAGGLDELRLKTLLSQFQVKYLILPRKTSWQKMISFFSLLRILRKERPALVVMEGTGIFGGLALIFARWFFRTRYVVSSGDSVADFFSHEI